MLPTCIVIALFSIAQLTTTLAAGYWLFSRIIRKLNKINAKLDRLGPCFPRDGEETRKTPQ